MQEAIKEITCFSCGALVPNIDGPVHAYMTSAPGCWKLYGEILAKEYSTENYDPIVHRITVDTYAVQHPGVPEKRAINSVNFHLIRLFLIFEKNLETSQANSVMQQVSNNEELHKLFTWLESPTFEKTLTVTDVIHATSMEEHKRLVNEWGLSVWNVWKKKHGTVIESLSNIVIA
jgi:hypothetical protein